MAQRPIQRALISTADKTGIVEFAKGLAALEITLIATGGSSKLLQEHNVPHLSVSDITGFPEILDGRVKTLHPAIHGGILSRRTADDIATLQQHKIEHIDLVIVNLYPFEKTRAIEEIDIGGPTLLRAAAKNFEHVTAVIDPNDYAQILQEIQQNQNTELATRQRLAAKVFQRLAHYNQLIADVIGETCTPLRYGENPQQTAFVRKTGETGIANAQQLQGKELSYNNYVDADAAWKCVSSFETPACVIVKHATPCGVATDSTNLCAYEKALRCDAQSAFGGVIAFNQTLDEKTAQHITATQFVEIIIAPDYSEAALIALQQKKNCRVLKLARNVETQMQKRTISGGELIQSADTKIITINDLEVVTKRQPTAQEYQDLLFAWNVVRYVKSNAIVFAKNGATLGIGTGQTSRVFAVEIAALKAQHAKLDLTNCAMASDAFFPFADGIEFAAKHGARAIIQPGGSKRDADVIAMADQFDIAMVFTHSRCFLH